MYGVRHRSGPIWRPALLFVAASAIIGVDLLILPFDREHGYSTAAGLIRGAPGSVVGSGKPRVIRVYWRRTQSGIVASLVPSHDGRGDNAVSVDYTVTKRGTWAITSVELAVLAWPDPGSEVLARDEFADLCDQLAAQWKEPESVHKSLLALGQQRAVLRDMVWGGVVHNCVIGIVFVVAVFAAASTLMRLHLRRRRG